jgi:hypothetical protein
MSDFDVLPTELCEQIMDCCDMRTMTALGATSKFWHIKRNECIFFRVFHLLEHFQLDPPPFLEFLTRTKSVISGSAALLIFHPGLFRPGDLDVYCEEEKLDDVLNFFETSTTYREPEKDPAHDAHAEDYRVEMRDEWEKSHLWKVLSLSCTPPAGSENMEPRLVNIIAVEKNMIIPVISHFHSTAVMNIITGTGVTCVYPELTFNMRGVINRERYFSLSRLGLKKLEKCLDKYRARGFDLALGVNKWSDVKSDPLQEYYGRLETIPIWAIPFPKAGAKRILNRVVLEETLWKEHWQFS